jgi:endonuclease/exonuclease/phosphatase family metal-dependent hydrolase
VERIAQVLETLRADIVGLQEANDPRNVERLAERLGMHHALAESRVSPFHVALLSRFPIGEPENLCDTCPALQRSCLRANVRVGSAWWRLAVLHLWPGGKQEAEELRMAELDELLPALSGEREPLLLMGDFNSTAPYHPHRSDGTRSADDTDGVPRRVVQRLLDAGWVDAVHRARPDEARHSVTTESPATRVDYIWLRPALADALQDAAVEQGHGAREASDHFPVRALLRA